MNLSVSVRPSHARLPKAHGVPTTASCFTLACTDQPRPWQLCRKVFMKPCLLSGPVSSRYCKFRYENKSLRLDATVIDYSPLLIIGAKVRHAQKQHHGGSRGALSTTPQTRPKQWENM